MGIIVIEIKGSFQLKDTISFSAMDRGHASAVARAIRYLADTVLPMAIKQDHQLHSGNYKPAIEFGGT